MGEATRIGWTDHTFNPWRGCAHAALADGSAHPGCDHCYAEAWSKRNPAALGTWGGPRTGARVMASAAYWRQPLKWNRAAEQAGVRRRVFCASLADVFEDWQGPIHDARRHFLKIDRVDNEFYANTLPDGPDTATLEDVRRKLFALIDETPHLDWLLLTKRPGNIPAMWTHGPMHKSNVWLLTSVSDQRSADALVPELLKHREFVPVLGLSVEPMVGSVDLRTFLPRLDWVIVGGESGPHYRKVDVSAICSVAYQCEKAGVPCYVKQDAHRLSEQQGRIPDAAWAIKQHPQVV